MINVSNGGTSWVLRKRFSEFDKLNKVIFSIHKAATNPHPHLRICAPFPEKIFGFFQTKLSKEEVASRRAQLGRYLVRTEE